MDVKIWNYEKCINTIFSGMGTKLDYSIFNPLARSSTSVVFVNDWDFLHTSSSSSGPIKENKYKFKSVAGHHYNSMDKLLEKHNMESIRKTMQLHEDIFKHQVRYLSNIKSVSFLLFSSAKFLEFLCFPLLIGQELREFCNRFMGYQRFFLTLLETKFSFQLHSFPTYFHYFNG